MILRQVNACLGSERASCRSRVMGRQHALRAVFTKEKHMQQFLAHGQVALQHRMHRILGSVMQALEGAGRTVCDCTDAVPWECTMDLARQVWDKARHVDIFMQLLVHVEGSIGEGPESIMLSRCAYLQAPEEPVAGINRGLEGLACDELVQLIELAQNIGDLVMERALDFVLADEMTHMRMRSTWLREQPTEAPERLRQALELQPSMLAVDACL